MKQIDEETLAILSRVTVEENAIFLTCGQLERKQYQAVNEVLENIGGKWNRKAKAHIYSDSPVDRLEQVLLTGEIVPPKKYGYFPTPPAIAKRLVDLAEITPFSFLSFLVLGSSPLSVVLEPSAGQGGIADYIPEDCELFCVELLPENAAVLKEKGYEVYQGDFLSVTPDATYTHIVMNPPFEKQQDIDHVTHAWKFLMSGGRLVSVMSAGILFRENKKTVDFRNFVEEHGYIERLPANSFKESGTGVNTCIIVINKP